MTLRRTLAVILALVFAPAGFLRAQSAAPADMKLFLLIGQSNMAGRGLVEPPDKVPHPRVFMLTKELAWKPAVDPLHFDKPDIAGVGLGSTFGRVVADAAPAITVGLIPAAFGGTSLDEWKPGGKLYSDAPARAREAIKRGQLAGILWHQGEADSAPEKAATYAERFKAMITQLRSDLGAPMVPVVVGETGRFRVAGAGINAALATLPKHVTRCAFVTVEGLSDKGDKTHFDTASLHELGRRYARAWQALATEPQTK